MQYTTGYSATSSADGLVTPSRCWSRVNDVCSPSIGHYLAVEQKVTGPLTRHRGSDLGVGRGEILAGARLELHLGAHFACDAALTVELALQ